MKVIVVGGGAAGCFGGITCAAAHPQARVQILEAGPQLLSKVRISGGGRCNVTHACFDPSLLVQHYPRGGKALWGAFSRFQPRDTIRWFSDRGVSLKTEADGRMFPISDDSATIADCLLERAAELGVEIRARAAVTSIMRTSEPTPGFRLQLKSGEILTGDRLLLATGSSPQGLRLAASLGHDIVPPVPSLFTFNLKDPRLETLAGIAVNPVQLKLQLPGHKPLEQTGPVLITHWGLSGPAVLKLSAWGARSLHQAHYRGTLQINWVPQVSPEKRREQLLAAKAQLAKRAIATACPLPLPQRLWQHLTSHAGIDATKRWAELSKPALNQLLQELTQGSYQVTGKGVFKEEFVTCGGVKLAEVDFKTMASRRCPGLYLAGEILDIDGITGGFNFQSAWTTGWLAGQAIAASG